MFLLHIVCCISYYSYIKPQLLPLNATLSLSCISYYSYIKPQLSIFPVLQHCVVYRTIPTSNHNSTIDVRINFMLYIVLFLHQTTTSFADCCIYSCCISYYSYIKPQLLWTTSNIVRCCISYYSYIKPQLNDKQGAEGEVVYRTIPTSNHNISFAHKQVSFVVYRTIPTSNHNSIRVSAAPLLLYIVLFLHQTTTGFWGTFSCSALYIVLFLHQTTTCVLGVIHHGWLYIVLFLHQTTTSGIKESKFTRLYIVLFLHQTTTCWW